MPWVIAGIGCLSCAVALAAWANRHFHLHP